MDHSLHALLEALKKIIWQLKPQHHALSFLILTGKAKQGKTSLLKQSQLEHVVVETDNSAHIFYNQKGIILELGESWVNQNKQLLSHTLKQLNRCHRALKVSGILFSIDINELLLTEPLQMAQQSKSHIQLLERFYHGLGYPVDIAICFTQLDAIAGFSEFFHYEHATELSKSLGFSLTATHQKTKLVECFQSQFDTFIEVLGQQVINKMHPARSNVKRTLIREFPLQLATLKGSIQAFIQAMPNRFHLQAIYFTSAEQGGVSLDRLNKKIQHEYSLVVQDKFPQSSNYRAFFIEGAIKAIQEHTKQLPANVFFPYKRSIAATLCLMTIGLAWVGYQHVKTNRLLDETSKELLAYESYQQNNNPTAALFHLTRASTSLDQLPQRVFTLSAIDHLKKQLHHNATSSLQSHFIPTLLQEVEQVMEDPRQTQVARYDALKVYIMLGDPSKFSQDTVLTWFQNHANAEVNSAVMQQKTALLKQLLHQPFQALPIKQQMVTDVRNYLNALPASYFYYSLIKNNFSTEKTPIQVEGFELPNKEVPIYFTKAGFQEVIASLGPQVNQFQNDRWVLERQDLGDLQTLLQQAYCYDYVLWWQNFMLKAMPSSMQDFQQARQLLQVINQNHSFSKLIDIIQQQTSPESGQEANLFNHDIASKFTPLNLMSHSSIQDLTRTINELEKFVNTLSIVNDQGSTAFSLIKMRFQGDALADPLTGLFNRSHQLPEPISHWAQHLANDTWFILINEARGFINQQWQQTVYQAYQRNIAGRYPFDPSQGQDVSIADFNAFFSHRGALNEFVSHYLKPFLDMSHPQWQLKEVNGYVLPVSTDMVNELIRANVITNMFFPDREDKTRIEFTLQKLNLDPVVASLQLSIGDMKLTDDQNSNSFTSFSWPQTNAKLTINSIEGNRYALEEEGPWAFFRMLQKVNVLVDEHDSSTLQILFEVNGNSGRYVLKAQNQMNPFIPGILNGFVLSESIT